MTAYNVDHIQTLMANWTGADLFVTSLADGGMLAIAYPSVDAEGWTADFLDPDYLALDGFGTLWLGQVGVIESTADEDGASGTGPKGQWTSIT